eukprot:m51a1_g804 hypothetical protein (144) ;mRNA; f:661312-661934
MATTTMTDTTAALGCCAATDACALKPSAAPLSPRRQLRTSGERRVLAPKMAWKRAHKREQALCDAVEQQKENAGANSSTSAEGRADQHRARAESNEAGPKKRRSTWPCPQEALPKRLQLTRLAPGGRLPAYPDVSRTLVYIFP